MTTLMDILRGVPAMSDVLDFRSLVVLGKTSKAMEEAVRAHVCFILIDNGGRNFYCFGLLGQCHSAQIHIPARYFWKYGSGRPRLVPCFASDRYISLPVQLYSAEAMENWSSE